MPYVDAFVVTVPKESLEAYKATARIAGKIWQKFGALAYLECSAMMCPMARSPSSRGRCRRRTMRSSRSRGSSRSRVSGVNSINAKVMADA
jgi:uncharacterized protein YbaA (DUF1428 family)